MTIQILNRSQARWLHNLAGINFKICYRAGSQNGKPDVLSRHSELRAIKEGIGNQRVSTILHENYFEENIIDDLAETNLEMLTITTSKLKEKTQPFPLFIRHRKLTAN
jgi:hypothetical protein